MKKINLTWKVTKSTKVSAMYCFRRCELNAY